MLGRLLSTASYMSQVCLLATYSPLSSLQTSDSTCCHSPANSLFARYFPFPPQESQHNLRNSTAPLLSSVCYAHRSRLARCSPNYHPPQPSYYKPWGQLMGSSVLRPGQKVVHLHILNNNDIPQKTSALLTFISCLPLLVAMTSRQLAATFETRSSLSKPFNRALNAAFLDQAIHNGPLAYGDAH
ncbi:hypothetical protein ANPL_04665 [Anaplasma platys]|uniref:Uncharacterized protein n=1 Tax=Anaplasma platys TaxID=949 RepID=A0A858PZE3_9RICK|nr:hypothetical protein ANPL_04665 [Anaplasma platys]